MEITSDKEVVISIHKAHQNLAPRAQMNQDAAEKFFEIHSDDAQDLWNAVDWNGAVCSNEGRLVPNYEQFDEWN